MALARPLANDLEAKAVDWRLSLAAFATLLAVTLLAGLAADLLPPSLRGSHAAYVTALQPHFVDRFFQWDAPWYERVARQGYVWNPSNAGHEQNIAFFPLWPIVIRFWAWLGLAENWQRWAMVALAGAIAVASVYAFQRLAQLVLVSKTARFATLLYAIWPAAVFLLQSYPTGLINLLTILGLEALLRGQTVRAALYSGIAVAAGPLAVALAVTVCVDLLLNAWRQAGAAPRRLPVALLRAAPLALLSVAGLAAFVAWQAVALGDPLAFVAAQHAWGSRQPLGPRLWQFVVVCLAVPDLIKALACLRYWVQLAQENALARAMNQLESAINLTGLAAALLLVPTMQRLGPRVIVVQALVTLILYVWFVAADNGGWATLRLIYPVPGIFLALAWLLQGRPLLARSVLAGCAGLLALHAFLMASGYSVI